MPTIDEVTDLALREIDRIATGVLPNTASRILPVVEHIAKAAIRAREGRVSSEQAEATICRLSGRLPPDRSRDQ
jgi:hypothetical protein